MTKHLMSHQTEPRSRASASRHQIGSESVSKRRLPPHTPLPWHWVRKENRRSLPECFVYGAGDALVCLLMRQFTPGQSLANAEFIVRACNQHDELTWLVKTATEILVQSCDQAAARSPERVAVSVREFLRRARKIPDQAESCAEGDWPDRR